jgi:hypothetical protein
MVGRNREAKQAAAILRAQSGNLTHYKIQEEHWDGVALIRVDKAPDNGPSTESLLVTTDTLPEMHQYIIRQYGLPPAQRQATIRQQIGRLFSAIK